MKIKIIIIFTLMIINIFLFKYLDICNSNKKALFIDFDKNSILTNSSNIELNDIKDFNFNNYFKIYSFKNDKYSYLFNDEKIIINFNHNQYEIDYKIIKPEIIKKIVYVENDTINGTEIFEINDDYIYIYNYELSYSIGTSLDTIRNDLANNIDTTYQTTIDYSNLNVSQIGQYYVFYITENEKIAIIIKII